MEERLQIQKAENSFVQRIMYFTYFLFEKTRNQMFTIIIFCSLRLGEFPIKKVINLRYLNI